MGQPPPKALKQALKLPFPYSLISDPELLTRAKRRAAVLVLFAPESQDSNQIDATRVLVIRRSSIVATHRDQFAFPGGKVEELDGHEGRNALIHAALREANEEVGLDSSRVTVLGELPELLTLTSFFRMTPIVAWCGDIASDVVLEVPTMEVASAHWVPWKDLQSPILEPKEYLGKEVMAPTYPLHSLSGEEKIWGATAVVIQNLADRLSRC